MIPISVTIARTDLWNNPGFIYPGAALPLPATRADIDDALDRARVTDGQPYKVIECIDGNGYEYYPEASYAADYGREVFFKGYNIDPNDPALEHLNFTNYGFALVKEHNAVQTDYGFIRKTEDMRQEQAQDDSAMQGMGGIS
jgi:hypothetical protein